VEYCGIEKEEEVVALEISNERFLEMFGRTYDPVVLTALFWYIG
jgi:hypothetical protein